VLETIRLRAGGAKDRLARARPTRRRRGAWGLPGRPGWLPQVRRFGLVGALNTALDLLLLNGLLWLFPTGSATRILAYTAVAYGLGAANSFLLNKYWTFGQRRRTTWGELARFALATLAGIGWNVALVGLAGRVAHPFAGALLWTNAAKLLAIGSGALLSYLGMRLWVFVAPSRPAPPAAGGARHP
jgi:putative flippase GtrA